MFRSILYLMILINGDDAYVAKVFKWYIMLYYGYEFPMMKSQMILVILGLPSCYSDKIYGWLWMTFWWCIQYIYVAYVVIFVRTRTSTKLEYTTSLFDDEPLISFMLMSSCLQRCIKFIWFRLWCRIPIVLGSHIVKDCCCWWHQESLTNDHELMVWEIHSWWIHMMLDTWMII